MNWQPRTAPDNALAGPVARARRLALTAAVLRALAALDILALAAVLLPRGAIADIHAALGLGVFPEAPIAGYLARSASAMYVLHGVTVMFVSFDVARYLPLIRFLACAALVHGALIFWVDGWEQLPRWWRWLEGPGFAATGLLVLACLPRGAGRRHRAAESAEPTILDPSDR